MKLLLDENVSSLVEKPLLSLGHEVLRMASGTKDRELINFSKKEKALLITHDKDFLALPFSESEGVILVRIHPPWSQDVFLSLKNLLMKTKPAEIKGKLVLLERDGFHIRF